MWGSLLSLLGGASKSKLGQFVASEFKGGGAQRQSPQPQGLLSPMELPPPPPPAVVPQGAPMQFAAPRTPPANLGLGQMEDPMQRYLRQLRGY